MAYILALDQGTTSSRAILFNRAGQVVQVAQQELTQRFPQAGWVEHDAKEIWRTQLAMAQSVLKKADIGAADVDAIGITNQRETTILWDRNTGEPVANAIVWQDRRTAGDCDTLRAQGHLPAIQKKTGLVLDAYFSATKLRWLLDKVPGARKRAARGELAFGTVDSWLIWNLTGGRRHVTDASNASRTLLFNIHTLQWDAQLLALFDIPASVLPEVLPCSGDLGHTDAALLGGSIRIAGSAGDQQAATFGQACFSPGMAKNTYGTGCFMLLNTGQRAITSRHQLLSTVAWVGPGERLQPSQACYALEGSVFVAGAAVQWLRDGLGIIGSTEEVEPLAASVPDTQDLYLVPAFAGLGTPDWDGYARGAMVGITRGTTRAHLARATLESIALQSADVFTAMSADSGIALRELRVDGGASRSNLLMQMQADFLGVPVVRPRVTETTALGAAYLAGLATGFWSDADELTAQWAVDRRFEPTLGDDARGAKRSRWRQAVERAKGWADH
ncbi:MAG: glycerol kinase GlpK [Burkholderiaceae bacterium]